MTLRARVLDVLDMGGPRKPSVLRAAADKRGEGAQFDAVIEQLKAENRIRVEYRHGGPHYAIVRQRGHVHYGFLMWLAGVLTIGAGVACILGGVVLLWIGWQMLP